MLGCSQFRQYGARSRRCIPSRPARAESEVPASVFWQRGRGKLQAHYTLTSTSSLFTRHAKLSANPTQPSPAYPSPPLVVRRLQRQQAAPTQRGVLGSTDSTAVPPGAGRKGSAPKKRLIRKLGFLGASTGLYCCALFHSVL
jgi:hypothetical protein